MGLRVFAGERVGVRVRVGTRAFLRELALAAGGAFAYFLVRGAVVDRAGEAVSRGRGIVALERDLGLFWEPATQAAVLGRAWLVDLANGVYFWGHMPVIIGVALWLWLRRRAEYRLARNAFLVSAVMALALYAALPVAPPRLLPELGLVDTMAWRATANYQAQEMGPFVNAYAALPSLHVGWALLLAVALWRARPRERRRGAAWGAAAALIPVAQTWAVLATANHFVLDVVAGAVVAGVAWGAALWWERRRQLRCSSAGSGASGV